LDSFRTIPVFCFALTFCHTFNRYTDFNDVLKSFFFTKVPVRIEQLMEDILEGHPGENDPPPCEMAGKDVKYESLFKEDREYNQVWYDA
jgi:hypothetical protein